MKAKVIRVDVEANYADIRVSWDDIKKNATIGDSIEIDIVSSIRQVSCRSCGKILSCNEFGVIMQHHNCEDEREMMENLRSAYQIADREGKNTNWEGFKNCVRRTLDRLHINSKNTPRTFEDNLPLTNSERELLNNHR